MDLSFWTMVKFWTEFQEQLEAMESLEPKDDTMTVALVWNMN
jgi:hypothetical protein